MAILLVVFAVVLSAGCIRQLEQLREYANSNTSITTTTQPALVVPEPLKDSGAPQTGFVLKGIHWEKKPINVYLTNETTDENQLYEYRQLEDVRKAFETWENNVPGLDFEFVKDFDIADVSVNWWDQLPPNLETFDFNHPEIGRTRLQYQYNPTSGTYIITHAAIHLQAQRLGRSFNDQDMFNMGVHEVGHVLGLNHSDYEKSIMFPTSKTSTWKESPQEAKPFSTGDITPLRKIYSSR